MISTKKTRVRSLGLVAASAVLLGLGADTPPRKIDAGGLTFQAPGSWKSTKPSSSMRRAQLSVDAAEGDTEPAELVVFAFPGGAGTVEANVERWRGQFRDGENKPPKVESKTVKGKNVDVTRVETAGRYVAPEFPGSAKAVNKPNFRLLGAIVQTDRGAYFLKMIGPDKTMLAARPAFDDLISSMEAEK